jgi:site-specific recombinase XerD
MTHSAAGQQAGSSRRRRSRRRATSTARRRRELAASQARAVAASFTLGAVAPVEPPPERLFVRRDVVSPADIGALAAACSPTSRVGLRDRALLAAGYYGCVRGIELAKLDVDDVDPVAGTLTIRGARNGLRVIGLPPEGVAPIAAWAAKRRRLRHVRMHAGLFCSLHDGQRPGPLTRAAIDEALARVARTARVAKPVTPDTLRMARAREVSLAGVGLPELSDLLDHMHIKTDGGPARDLRQDLDRTRRLVTEVAPGAPCLGFYKRSRSPITLPEYRRGCRAPNAGRTFPAEVLTRDEMTALLRRLTKGPTGIRNRALIVVLWRCGLRIAEALALEPRDVDLTAGTLLVRHGKGDKRRIVGIDPRASSEIERWLTVRARELGLPARGPVFCTVALPTRGRAMHSSVVREMLKDLAARAGVDKRVHPHGLRHTHAFELMQEGVPLPIIQKQLGHNDLATTARYVDHLAPVHVIRAMQARDWRA